MIYIYTLEHPITGEIRYIGKTNNIKKRLVSHISDTRDTNNRTNWILSLKNKNLRPILQVLEEVDLENWQEREIYWIAQFKAWGFRLINSTTGGNNNTISHKCRKELSKKVKGIPNSYACKKCYAYKPNGEYYKCYNSIKDASNELGIPSSNIGKAIKTNKFAKKLYWRYTKEDNIILNPIYSLEGKYIRPEEARKATGMKNSIILKGRKWTEAEKLNLSRIRKETGAINNIRHMRSKLIKQVEELKKS